MLPRSYSRHLQLNIYSRNKKEKVTLPNAMTSRNIFLKKAAVTCSIKIYIYTFINCMMRFYCFSSRVFKSSGLKMSICRTFKNNYNFIITNWIEKKCLTEILPTPWWRHKNNLKFILLIFSAYRCADLGL